jgi:hypothetical protein
MDDIGIDRSQLTTNLHRKKKLNDEQYMEALQNM